MVTGAHYQLLGSSLTLIKNRTGIGQSCALPRLGSVVRPAGFEPAAYGFEEQESLDSKIQ